VSVQAVNPAAVEIGRLVGRFARVRPLYIVAPLCVLSFVVALAVGLHAQHNGWLYYTGGDGTYYWTLPWALAHHVLPATTISYGLPVLTWPLALVFGPTVLPALPVIILFQVLVLGTLGVIGVYGIANHLGGRLFAAVAAFVWVLSPLVAEHFFYPRIRPQYQSIVLPQTVGLNNIADYPTMILCILIAWLVLRVLDYRRWNDVALAGILCGFLIAIKPSTGFFVPAPVVALLAARYWRETAGFVVAMIPALVTLAIWKQAGLGHIPLFGAPGVHLAAGTPLEGSIGGRINHYIPFSWNGFTGNLAQIREYGWSLRVAEWVPVAGLIGAFRRSIPQALLLGIWCFDYLVLKGGTAGATVYSWAFFRFTMPGFPAYVLLACCIVFALPGLGRRWLPRVKTATRLKPTRTLIAAAVVLGLYPFVFVLAHGGSATNKVALDSSNNLAAISDALHVHVVQTSAGPSVRWQQPDTGSTQVGYVVFKDATSGCTPAGRDCDFNDPLIALVHSLNFPAWRYGKGVYRIGLVAGPRISRNDGDMMLLSPPVVVR
jgi:hypothetical protein